RARIPQLDALVDALHDDAGAAGREQHLAHARVADLAERRRLAVGRPQAYGAVDAPGGELAVGRKGGARDAAPHARGHAAAERVTEDGLRRAPVAGVGVLLEPGDGGGGIVVERLLRLRQHQLALALLRLRLRGARLGP